MKSFSILKVVALLSMTTLVSGLSANSYNSGYRSVYCGETQSYNEVADGRVIHNGAAIQPHGSYCIASNVDSFQQPSVVYYSANDTTPKNSQAAPANTSDSTQQGPPADHPYKGPYKPTPPQYNPRQVNQQNRAQPARQPNQAQTNQHRQAAQNQGQASQYRQPTQNNQAVQNNQVQTINHQQPTQKNQPAQNSQPYNGVQPSKSNNNVRTAPTSTNTQSFYENRGNQAYYAQAAGFPKVNTQVKANNVQTVSQDQPKVPAQQPETPAPKTPEINQVPEQQIIKQDLQQQLKQELQVQQLRQQEQQKQTDFLKTQQLELQKQKDLLKQQEEQLRLQEQEIEQQQEQLKQQQELQAQQKRLKQQELEQHKLKQALQKQHEQLKVQQQQLNALSSSSANREVAIASPTPNTNSSYNNSNYPRNIRNQSQSQNWQRIQNTEQNQPKADVLEENKPENSNSIQPNTDVKYLNSPEPHVNQNYYNAQTSFLQIPGLKPAALDVEVKQAPKPEISQDDNHPSKYFVKEKKNILEVAKDNPNLSTFVSVIEASGLESQLQGEGPYTIFAPSNEAFKQLPRGALERLLKPENQRQLYSIIAYHVIPGKIPAKDIKTASVKSLTGKEIQVEVTRGNITVDDAEVIRQDIPSSNGIIHIIDEVMLPN